jgi:hypothetical protein
MVEEPLQDSVRTSSNTAGGFVESLNDVLDSTILAQEIERERARSQESESERTPSQEFEREQAPNTGIQLDSRQVRTIGIYVTLDIYVV